ncbi:unnamed protein product [Phaeothamnion confervicola]
MDSDGWESVVQVKGIVVTKKVLPPPSHDGGDITAAAATAAADNDGQPPIVDEAAAAKFACVKAVATLNARAEDLYALFLTNDRVHEFNENCEGVEDLEYLTPTTKVTWAWTPRYGPFKARDFVTVVNYRRLADGTFAVVNRPVDHPKVPRGGRFLRAEILIASNLMRQNSKDSRLTDFVTIAHVNPGGIVDSALGAKIVNMLCAQAPVRLLQRLEAAANSPPRPRPGGGGGATAANGGSREESAAS